MKALSNDLRKRILEAWQKEKKSFRQIARRFAVNHMTVARLIKLYEETGTIVPRPRPGKKGKSGFHYLGKKFLMEYIQKKPDATLKELCFQYEKKFSISFALSTMSMQLKSLA